jgi:hypothetical protein
MGSNQNNLELRQTGMRYVDLPSTPSDHMQATSDPSGGPTGALELVLYRSMFSVREQRRDEGKKHTGPATVWSRACSTSQHGDPPFPSGGARSLT